ncbi:hypothetical protein [Bacillus sp. FJAT-42315]|uniref:hypothetical protein n=1 Tax=Bacillus sp. FJAT-42315 TaxID=2014077 RepID=UPI000C242018|nr:hypothetical protein [Bacillus sp. FJAT-42315]
MKKEQLIQLIHEKFDEEDSILIEDLNEIFLDENESVRNQALLRALHSEQFEIDFEESLDKVIRDLAVQITQYIFRSGSIEGFHAGIYNFEDYENIPLNTPVEKISQLTQANMRTLNKELVDKIGFLLHLFASADYLHLNTAINGYKHYGSNWDAPDIQEVESDHNDYVLLRTGMDKFLKE